MLCFMAPVLGHLCFVLVYTPLLAKSYRIYRIFYSKKIEFKFTDNDITKIIAGGVLVFLILVTIWGLAGPPGIRTIETEDTGEIYTLCQSEGLIPELFFIAEGMLLLAGCVVSFLTRNVRDNFNESKGIAMTIYNSLVISLIVLPIVKGIFLGPELEFIVIAVAISLLFMNVQAFIFVPKFIIILTGADQDYKNNTSAFSAKSGQTQGLASKAAAPSGVSE